MTREIKFRIRNLREQCVDHIWGDPEDIYIRASDGKAFYFDGFANDLLDYDDSENICIEQYTGLKDKNGKEIYEGDIVVTEQLKELPDCDIWHRSELGKAYITITPESGVVFKTLDNDIWNWDEADMITNIKYIKIIGNIHE